MNARHGATQQEGVGGVGGGVDGAVVCFHWFRRVPNTKRRCARAVMLRARQSFVAAHAQQEGICDACVIALSVVLDTAHVRHLYAYVVIGTAVVLTGFIIQSKNHASVLQIDLLLQEGEYDGNWFLWFHIVLYEAEI